jgi:hypothetical protein
MSPRSAANLSVFGKSSRPAGDSPPPSRSARRSHREIVRAGRGAALDSRPIRGAPLAVVLAGTVLVPATRPHGGAHRRSTRRGLPGMTGADLQLRLPQPRCGGNFTCWQRCAAAGAAAPGCRPRDMRRRIGLAKICGDVHDDAAMSIVTAPDAGIGLREAVNSSI